MLFRNKCLSFFCSINTPNTEKQCYDEESTKEPIECKQIKNTYFEGLTNNFRSTVGTGLLTVPLAFRQVGYLGGTIGVIFIMIITNYCALILVGCQRELLQRNKNMLPTFQGTVQAAFAGGPKPLRSLAPFFVAITNIFLIVSQIGFICVDFVFIATNIKAGSKSYFDIDLEYIEILVFLPVLAFSMIPNMKKLSVVSSVGSTCFLISIGVMVYFFFREPISFEGKEAFGSLEKLDEFIGTIFFSSVTISLVLPMQNEMANPSSLQGPCGVLNFSAFLCCILYIFFGISGYLKYGNKVADSITLNLPTNNWLSLVVQTLLCLSAFTSLAVVLYVGVSVIWDDYMDQQVTRHRTLARYILRIGFVTVILMISLMVPSLQLLLSVLGIITQCTLSTTMPCIVNVLTYYQQPSLWAYIRKFWLDAITFLFTVFVLVYSLF